MSPPPRRDSAAATAAASQYDIDCRRCVRLAAFVDQVREANPSYFCRPVPPFGDGAARLVIVGLAPGMHGANASGRPFTGDYAGILLYATLFKFGFSTRATSSGVDDGLRRIAHDATLRALGLAGRDHPFSHGGHHPLNRGAHLFDSYHCSRYNTNTRRLTTEMFEAVFASIVRHLEAGACRAA